MRLRAAAVPPGVLLPNLEAGPSGPVHLAGPDPAPTVLAVGPRMPEPEAAARKKQPAVHYLGFRITPDGREYMMQVLGELEPRTYVLLVTHEAFATRQTRFQDAPDLCSRKLERALLADPDLIAAERLLLTAEELLDYRHAHAPASAGRPRRGS